MKWTDITREDVLEAIRRFVAYQPEHPKAKFTFLIHDGRKFPAKHIRGMAYEVHFKEKAYKSDFSGGKETVYFFLRLGFEVEFRGERLTPDQTVPSERKKEEHSHSPAPIVTKKFNFKLNSVKKVEDKTNVPLSACQSTPSNIASSQQRKYHIPQKGVTEQKNAMQRLLNRMFDGDVVCEKKFTWMVTPTDFDEQYQKLFDVLYGYRGHKEFAKKNRTLSCDYVIESQKLIIEYDERQHFSEARKQSFSAYMDIPVYYNRDAWIVACDNIKARDNQPIDRDEGRAYYDSVRDIEAYRNGYRLIRIMHGMIDFEGKDAEVELRKVLNMTHKVNIKVGLYLQTDSYKNESDFEEAIDKVKSSDIDILVFPEVGWFPFENFKICDIENEYYVNTITQSAMNFSKKIGRAVVMCALDSQDTIFSIYANAFASKQENDTVSHIYAKHTATEHSAFEFHNYHEKMKDIFEPIRYKGYKIGLTICYDCNHSMFSRMYGLQNVDLIINSTGGNVRYEQWRKYNKVRAIENHCYTLVTMGRDDIRDNNYVFGFNREGGELSYYALHDTVQSSNVPGTVYVYDLAQDTGIGDIDTRLNQKETECQYQLIRIPVGKSEKLLRESKRLREHLYIKSYEDMNLVIVVADNQNILLPENHLPLLYDTTLKAYRDKRYLILCRYDNLDETFYKEKLSVLLKVRAMENYCAVILESPNHMNCFQTAQTRNSQAVKAVDGFYGLDTNRMKGPEVIWRDTIGMKGSWRKNLEWLIGEMGYLKRKQCDRI